MTDWLTPAWVVQTLIASALLMALVLAVRGPVRHQFGARIAYALWLLPALRMILPPLPGWRMLAVPVLLVSPHRATLGLADPVDALKLAGPLAGQPLPDVVMRIDPVVAAAAFPSAPLDAVAGIDWAMLAFAIWLGGALLVFGWQMLGYRRFLRRALSGSVPLARECGIEVLVSGSVSGPVAAGILHRRILLPTDFLARYSSDERRLALKHEAAHHDRCDILANLAALAIVALHWWNPFAYRAYRAFRDDQELACDATVLAEAAPGERRIYGSAMLKSASARMPAMACALSHKDQLKQRIGMMARTPAGVARLVCGAALTTVAVAGGLLLTASGQAQPAEASLPPAPPPVVAAPPRPFEIEAASRRADREQAEARRHVAAARRAARAAEREVARAERAADAAARHAIVQDARADATIVAIPAPRIPDVARLVQASLDGARADLAARCAAKGVTMPGNADFGTLATCGDHLRETVRTALLAARHSIARERAMSDEARAHALAGIDRAIAEQDRRD